MIKNVIRGNNYFMKNEILFDYSSAKIIKQVVLTF